MPVAVCVMGPTASGKTDLAVRLAERFDVDLISVDSALVYRGMDIGTAKPDPETLAAFPHALVDIREPEERYSAGEFVDDALDLIQKSFDAGKLPVLVGGTMMYFRALTGGLASLPKADAELRAEIDAEAERLGWPALHARLAGIDPDTAARISENDSQRIQRALEVYELTGQTLTALVSAPSVIADRPEFLKIGLTIEPRRRLHERIATRLDALVEAGFEDEVRRLMQRPELTAEHPSMRCVGYRQIWGYLDGRTDRATALDKALFATRQLAKRQITWLRSESSLHSFDALYAGTFDAVSGLIAQYR